MAFFADMRLADSRRCPHRRRLCAEHHLHRASVCYHTLDRRNGSVQYVRLARMLEYRRGFDCCASDHLGSDVASQVGWKV